MCELGFGLGLGLRSVLEQGFEFCWIDLGRNNKKTNLIKIYGEIVSSKQKFAGVNFSRELSKRIVALKSTHLCIASFCQKIN